jgi:nucleotide-binding universal stress UspA family protein
MEHTMKTRRIVVGVDGSEASKDALRWAKAHAESDGAEVVAVSAWSYPVASFPMLVNQVATPETFDVEGETRASLARVVKETLGDAEVTQQVFEGHPVTVMLAAARDADLVVVGSRGHGGFVGSLLGSVSQSLVAHADCPVVVIRHPKKQAAETPQA